MTRLLVALLTLLLALPAHAAPAQAPNVVCTLPWLGDIARRLAPAANVTVLAKGTEDPHYLSPTPALMAKVQSADLYIENGLSLELWSERVLDGAGNPRIRPGQPGYVRASDNVPRLEVPTDISRAKGDLHPDGNPHIWTDPLNAAIAADNIAAGLGRVDPTHAAEYKQRAAAFRAEIHKRLFGADLVAFMGGESLEKLARAGKLREYLASKGLESRLGGWMAAAKPGTCVVFYHQSWTYFVNRFGTSVGGYVEDRPGVAPSAAHKDQLAAAMKAQSCKVIGHTSYYDDRISKALAASTGARLAVVPGDVGGLAGSEDYFLFIDTLVRELGR